MMSLLMLAMIYLCSFENDVFIADFNNFSVKSVGKKCTFVTSYKLSHKHVVFTLDSVKLDLRLHFGCVCPEAGLIWMHFGCCH